MVTKLSKGRPGSDGLTDEDVYQLKSLLQKNREHKGINKGEHFSKENVTYTCKNCNGAIFKEYKLIDGEHYHKQC